MIRNLRKTIVRRGQLRCKLKNTTVKENGVSRKLSEAWICGREVDVRVQGRQLLEYGFRYVKPIHRRFWLFGPWCANLIRIADPEPLPPVHQNCRSTTTP